MEYRGKAVLLKDALTPWGWPIRDANELVLALEGFAALQSVAEGSILHAIAEALKEKQEYDNITDLANYLLQNHI